MSIWSGDGSEEGQKWVVDNNVNVVEIIKSGCIQLFSFVMLM